MSELPKDPFAEHTGELRRLRDELADRYQIERELGGGGMSRVFAANDRALDRRVVIKVLHPELAASLSLERFKREVMVGAGLQHANIVPVLTAGEAGGLPYFVMPFIAGESLRERLVRGPLSVRETVSIMKDVARALAFAHDRGIVHRDIKPGNILLSAGAAVVTDFGIAKALRSARETGSGRRDRSEPTGSAHTAPQTLTQIGTSIGTPAYMAPEQASGDPAADHRADIYALGVVAWEMLVGTPPFHGRSPQALLTAQLSETPPAIASRRYDVPEALHTLIMRCLEKSATLRPKSAMDLLRQLEDPELLSGAFASPSSTTARAWRRRRGPLTLGAVTALALGLGAWWTLRRGPTADPSLPLIVATPAPVLGRSIAVLPLAPIGRDVQAAAIADGITSQLTSVVAGVPRLRVASGTATAALRDRRAMPAEIGRTLGVALLLEGTVQREGTRVRVALRLVSAANDSTLWSDTFNGEVGATLALQDSAGRAVTAALTSRLGAQ